MRHLLPVVFILLFSSLWSTPSEGIVRTLCENRDCLTHGWTTFDTQTGEETFVQCKFLDCRSNGWEIFASKRDVIPYAEVVCLIDCFEVGRYYIDLKTYERAYEIQCAGSDCLELGWLETTNSGSRIRVQCTANGRSGPDCRNAGWFGRDEYSGQIVMRALCLGKGCFISGRESFRL